MALLLTSAQIAAIAAGERVRQVWSVYAPIDAAHSAYDSGNTFHDSVQIPTAVRQNVQRAGKRTYTAVNASPMDDRKLQRARHAFVVRNDDGRWYPSSATTCWWRSQSTPAYAAQPQECRIRHRCYVLVAGAWSEITALDYTGQVVACDWSDTVSANGVVSGSTATIQTEAMGAWEVLAKTYTKDDGAETWVDLQFDSTYP
jgi:hypothetical protein